MRTATRQITVNRSDVRLDADPSRVISRLFLPADRDRIKVVVDRVTALSEDTVRGLLARVITSFNPRHRDMPQVFRRHFDAATSHLDNGHVRSEQQRLLIGAYFTSEYSLESVALFNPSIVPHPDQSGAASGAERFIMSLRACGEGHVSSIVFRTGVIDPLGNVTMDPVAALASTEKPVRDKRYQRHPFTLKLIEVGAYNAVADAIIADLGDTFTLDDLQRMIDAHRGMHRPFELYEEASEKMLWLARSNYHLAFPENYDISEQVIYPVTENESRGIEDARFVRFETPGEEAIYYATYTAYNGVAVLPQLIETGDFHRFKIITLNGKCVQNKGMALFPRKVNGAYCMFSRLDGGNLYLMSSNNLHFWNQATQLKWNAQPWEFIQVGNCGSPIETKKGWLLLTHGVGPMRQYSIGAALLDLDDPSRVIAHLEQPLIVPDDSDRDGYVPNVVYSCGAMVHNDILILPYATSDTSTGIATIAMPELLARL